MSEIADYYVDFGEPKPVPVPECEAERRIKQTLYVMENDWASGSFDYGKVKQMLTGRKDDTCTCEAERMSA